MTGRSLEAKKRRQVSRSRIACSTCNLLHAPPACDKPGAVRMTIDLPPHVHRALVGQVDWGTRSPWIVRLIRRELGV